MLEDESSPLSQKGVWSGKRGSPMLISRTNSCRNLRTTHNTLNVHTIRSFNSRTGARGLNAEGLNRRQQLHLEVSETCEKCFTPTSALRRQSITEESVWSERLSSGPRAVQRGHRKLPLVYQPERKDPDRKCFWKTYQLIRQQGDYDTFARAWKLAQQRIAPQQEFLSLTLFTKILQETLQCVLDYSEVYFIYSLLSNLPDGTICTRTLQTAMKVLFVAESTFSVAACQHILEHSQWPFYLSISVEEVVDLFMNLKVYYRGGPGIVTSTHEVLAFLRMLGYTYKVPLSTLHNAIAGNSNLAKTLRLFEAGKRNISLGKSFLVSQD